MANGAWYFYACHLCGELVKTARADRSSVKPLQFIPVSSPPRIGCRTMCPTGCLPAASCAAIVLLACRSLIRLALPSRRAYPLGMFVSSHPICSCYTSSPRSAYPPRLSCRRAGRHHLVLISSCVPPTVMCSAYRLAFRPFSGVRLRVSSSRSCVPLLPCRPCFVSLVLVSAFLGVFVLCMP